MTTIVTTRLDVLYVEMTQREGREIRSDKKARWGKVRGGLCGD